MATDPWAAFPSAPQAPAKPAPADPWAAFPTAPGAQPKLAPEPGPDPFITEFEKPAAPSGGMLSDAYHFVADPIERGYQSVAQSTNVLTNDFGIEDPTQAAIDIASRQKKL